MRVVIFWDRVAEQEIHSVVVKHVTPTPLLRNRNVSVEGDKADDKNLLDVANDKCSKQEVNPPF